MLFSDSDDDIDLSSIKKPASTVQTARRVPAPPAASEPDLRRVVYEKAGENAILREQLTMQASKHTQAVNNLMDSHQRMNDAHIAELEKLRQQLKSAEAELQFAKEEVRMKSINGNGPQKAVSQAIPPKAAPVRSLPAQFADGFLVKRPRLSQNTKVEPTETAMDVLAMDTLPQSYNLSIQSLFNIPDKDDPSNTVGALISAKDKPEDQLAETMRILARLTSEIDSSVVISIQPILVLVFAFCQRGFVLQPREVGTIDKLLDYCLTHLKPLSSIQNTIDTFIVCEADAATVSVVLYALDVLLCTPVKSVSPVFFDRILASKIPLVIQKGLEVLAELPNLVLDERKFFFDAPPEPKLELLFGGILDDKLHTLSFEPYVQNYLDTKVRKKDLDMDAIIRDAYLMQKAAGILLAASREPSPFKTAEVEKIFVAEVDSPITYAHTVLISRCVWYLWVTLDKSDRSGNNVDELVVSCARVAYSQDYPQQVTMWALDILHQSVDPAEMNFIADLMV